MKALDYLYSMKKANEDMGTEPITIYEAIEELEALISTTTQQTIQSKFKVGDWVENITCTSPRIIKQVVNAPEGHDTVTVGNVDVGINVLLITDIKLWKPKPDEWCWVYDDKTQIPYLRKFVCINNIVTSTPASYSYKVEYESDIVSYKYIEPFIGVLPSAIEQH